MVSTALGVPQEELFCLPEQLVTKAMETLGMSLLQQARILLERGKRDPTGVARNQSQGSDARTGEVAVGDLRVMFEAQEQRRLFPWKASAEMMEAERKAILAQPAEELYSTYIDSAKAGLLSPEDAMLLGYLLDKDASSRHLLAGWILRRSPKDRVICHNHAIAAKCEEAFRHIHGVTLMTMPWPLFPQGREFSALNQKILTESGSISGGSAHETVRIPSVFRKQSVSGSGFLPCGQIDGAWYADSTRIENEIQQQSSRVESALRRQIAALERRVTDLGGTVRKPGETRAPNESYRGRGNRGRGGDYMRRGAERVRGGETEQHQPSALDTEVKKDNLGAVRKN